MDEEEIKLGRGGKTLEVENVVLVPTTITSSRPRTRTVAVFPRVDASTHLVCSTTIDIGIDISDAYSVVVVFYWIYIQDDGNN